MCALHLALLAAVAVSVAASPPGAAAATKPNIVLLITDDQDTLLGSMRTDGPLQMINKHLVDEGATFLSMFVSTPVCCPSRSALLTSQFPHNYKQVEEGNGTSCMQSHKEAFPLYLQNAGYATGAFGKFLNSAGMQRFCPNFPGGGHEIPRGWSSTFLMCPDTCYTKCTFAVNGTAKTPTSHAAYATSLIGNRSLDFVNANLQADQPFFAYIAPHAPHLPCTPAPWYTDRFPGAAAPRTPGWNASGAGHHWIVSQQPPLTSEGAGCLDDVFKNRWRTLLSVDDLFFEVHQAVAAAGALANTFFVFTSDHGFHLGQLRLGSAKRQPYETDIRVPLYIAGPGVVGGTNVGAMVGNIDLGPTFLEIAGVPAPSFMNGHSLMPLLRSAAREAGAPAAAAFRNTFLIEYQGSGKLKKDTCKRLQTAPNNTFIAVRFLADNSSFLYAEFGTSDYDWDRPQADYFHELFNLITDPHQLSNLYPAASTSVRAELHGLLRKMLNCTGAECVQNQALPAALQHGLPTV